MGKEQVKEETRGSWLTPFIWKESIKLELVWIVECSATNTAVLIYFINFIIIIHCK